jgi:hypothetical protein
MLFAGSWESSNFNPFWIPAGVYPVAERGRNDETIELRSKISIIIINEENFN